MEQMTLSPSLHILGVTDKQGHLIDVNDEFIQVSGFSREELLGKTYQLIRHPDVPDVVFEDMWQTILDGQVWGFPIKNKTKSGQHYWVVVNVLPVFDAQDQLTGFCSAQTPAAPAEIAFAESAYQALTQGCAKLERGCFYQQSVTEKIKKSVWSQTSLQGRWLLMLMLVSLLPVVVAGVLTGLSAVQWLVSVVIALGLSLLAYRLLLSDVIYPVQELSQMVKQVSETGELHHRAYSLNLLRQDTIGESFRSTQQLINMTHVHLVRMHKLIQRSKSYRFQDQIHIMMRGDYELINQELMHLLVVQAERIDVLSEFAVHLAQGNFKYRVQSPAGDKANVLERILNHAMSSFDHSFSQLTQIIQDLSHGVFHSRVNISQVSEGDVRIISEALNKTLTQLDRFADETLRITSAMAVSNLDVRFAENFEGDLQIIARTFNLTLDNIATLIAQVNYVSQVVFSDAQKMTLDSKHLFEESQGQSNSLEVTATNMEKMILALQKNSEIADQANHLVKEANHEVTQGVDVMHATVSAMQSLEVSSNKIAEIVGLIEGIAFQTNLLAINAAVEAARSGEHGRGFAVVAGEVRNLALKSSDSAKDIKGLINTIVQQVAHTTSQVNQAGDAFERITQSITESSGLVSEIAARSNSRERGFDNVSHAIVEMGMIAHQSNQLMNVAATSAQGLMEQAQLLSIQVSRFLLPREQDNELYEIIKSGHDDLLVLSEHLKTWFIAIMLAGSITDEQKRAEHKRKIHQLYGKIEVWLDTTRPTYGILASFRQLEQQMKNCALLMDSVVDNSFYQVLDQVFDGFDAMLTCLPKLRHEVLEANLNPVILT